MKGISDMKVSKELEHLLLNANLKTNMNILITDEKEIVYFIGKPEVCAKYLYSEISNELKQMDSDSYNIKFFRDTECIDIIQNDNVKYLNQCICKFYKDDNLSKCVVFYKEDSEFKDDDIFIINSTIYLIEKYFK